jgi:hypothetical protein
MPETVDQRMSRIQQECEEIASMQAQFKRSSMIYQHSAKVEAARRRGLPFDTFFHMHYEEWAKIREDA